MLLLIKNILKSQSFKNSFWNVANAFFYPILMIIATPIFINNLGADQFGIWILINSIIGSLGILNFGLGAATVKYVSHYRATNDYNNINNIINTTFTFYSVLSIILILAGVLGIDLIKSLNIISFETENLSLTFSALKLGLVLLGFRFIEQALLSIFQGFERYDISSIISIISRFSLLSIQVIIVLNDYSLIEIFTASIIMTIIILIVEFYILKSKYKDINIRIKFNKKSFKEIFSFGIWSWVQSIFTLAASHLDTFIVAGVAGPAILGYYAIGQMVDGKIRSIFTAASSWIFPKVSNKLGKNENIKNIYYTMQFIVIVGGLLILSVFYLMGDYIFLTWLGKETYENSKRFIEIFLIITAFGITSIIPYYYLNGSGHVRLNTFFSIASTIVNVISMLILFKFYGIIGLALGRIVSPITVSLVARSILHHRILGEKSKISGLNTIIPSMTFTIIVLLNMNFDLSFLHNIPLVMTQIVIIYLTLFRKISLNGYIARYIKFSKA
jgi:O-antigen/teichoic acid export membrane protein